MSDLDRSLGFYTRVLGMKLLRREDYDKGRFTLVFLGYGAETDATVIELTHNWDDTAYDRGTAYGHIALAVHDIEAVCKRLRNEGVTIVREPGPMKFSNRGESPDVIAFVEDPDGYPIELIERS